MKKIIKDQYGEKVIHTVGPLDFLEKKWKKIDGNSNKTGENGFLSGEKTQRDLFSVLGEELSGEEEVTNKNKE